MGLASRNLKTFLVLCALKLSAIYVDLATCWLTNHDLREKVDELGASFGPAGRKSQNRVQSIERLDGGFLVDAEYSGVHRWFKV
jgi:hypothetical protein